MGNKQMGLKNFPSFFCHLKPSKTPRQSPPSSSFLRNLAMAWRSGGSLSRSLISTARTSTLRSSPPLPRLRPPPLAAPRRLYFGPASRSLTLIPENLTKSLSFLL